MGKWNQMTTLSVQTGGRHQTSPASLRGALSYNMWSHIAGEQERRFAQIRTTTSFTTNTHRREEAGQENEDNLSTPWRRVNSSSEIYPRTCKTLQSNISAARASRRTCWWHSGRTRPAGHICWSETTSLVDRKVMFRDTLPKNTPWTSAGLYEMSQIEVYSRAQKTIKANMIIFRDWSLPTKQDARWSSPCSWSVSWCSFLPLLQ